KNQNTNNVPATINKNTGEISFKSHTKGNFVLVIKIQSYKCGNLVSEVYREMQVVIIDCDDNDPPQINPPFNGGTSFSKTVVAGEKVNFTLNITDNNTLQDGSKDSITTIAFGNQFGDKFIDDSSGCSTIPCATLSDTLPQITTDQYTTTFNWQTTCEHLSKNDSGASCVSNSNTYTFVFKAKDNFCRAPGVTMPTIKI
ncbi:MAG: hypothetical protein ABEH43_04080, partial [Flavobacteriales bacterium]